MVDFECIPFTTVTSSIYEILLSADVSKLCKMLNFFFFWSRPHTYFLKKMQICQTIRSKGGYLKFELPFFF